MRHCSTCERPACDASLRACTAPDCELLVERVALRCRTSGMADTPAGIATIARYLHEERAGHGQSQSLGRVVERAAVHEVEHV